MFIFTSDPSDKFINVLTPSDLRLCSPPLGILHQDRRSTVPESRLLRQPDSIQE